MFAKQRGRLAYSLIGAVINWYAVTESFMGSSLETWFNNNLNYIPGFDELGIFSLGIINAAGGAATPADFNIGKNLDGVRMNLYLGKRFLARNLYEDATFKEAKQYDVDSSKPEPSGEQPTNNTPSGDVPGEGD